MSAELVVCEEFAFMKLRMFHDVIVPLLLMEKTATICITTLSTIPGNHATAIIENRKMEVMDISLVCPSCKIAGKADKCRHMEWLRPQWQTTARYDYVQTILGAEAFAREAQGILMDASNTCFNSQQVRKLFDKPRFILEETDHFEYMFLTIDPSGNNPGLRHKSEFAFGIHASPGFRVISVNSIKVMNPASWQPVLIDTLKTCFRIPALASAKLVVFVEGNMDGHAHAIQQEIWRHFPDAVFPGSRGDKALGVWTDPQSKHNMQQEMQLALSSGGITIFRDLISAKPPQEILAELRSQLLRFSCYSKESEDVFRPAKYKFSGKGTSGNLLDDLVMMLMMAWYYTQMFFQPRSPWLMYHAGYEQLTNSGQANKRQRMS